MVLFALRKLPPKRRNNQRRERYSFDLHGHTLEEANIRVREIIEHCVKNKYKELLVEHSNLSKKLEEIQNKEKIEERKQIEFSEKIDELNQETDTLIEEIDKWQM